MTKGYKKKKQKKTEKYQPLKDGMARLWDPKKVKVIPVVISALGMITKKFEGYIKECDDNIRIEVIQKTTLLGSARILRKVLSMKDTENEALKPLVACCYLLSRNLPN